MGQQQLLLLVLATVIVGLATVAGIQTFDENQAQASQDALTQRATSIVSDIKGLQGKPTQLGGINLNSNDGLSGDAIARKLALPGSDGISSADGAYTFGVDGAGSGGNCKVEGTNSGDASSGEALVTCKADDAPQDVQVKFTASTSGSDSSVETTFGDKY